MSFLQSHKISGVLFSQGSWLGLLYLQGIMALPMHWLLFVESTDCQSLLSQFRAVEELKMADLAFWSLVFDDFFFYFYNYGLSPLIIYSLLIPITRNFCFLIDLIHLHQKFSINSPPAIHIKL